MRAVNGNLAMPYGMDEKTQQWETKPATLAEKRTAVLTAAVRVRICSVSAGPEPPRNSRRRASHPSYC